MVLMKKSRKKTNKYWIDIPKRTGTDKSWHYNEGVVKDPMSGLTVKNICPISREETKRGTRLNHPKHIAVDGFCIHCGVLK